MEHERPRPSTCPALARLTTLAASRDDTPRGGTNEPGWFRWTFGDVEVTALSDGCFDVDADAMLRNVPDDPHHRTMDLEPDGTSISVPVNAYLIDTGRRRLLIDTGAAGLFGPTLGRLASNLRAAGHEPSGIDDVLLTHMHPDHVGGLVVDGRCAFPRATVHVAARELHYWTGAPSDARRDGPSAPFVDEVAATIAPYVEANAVRTFEAPTILLDDVLAIPMPGHTPGHTIFALDRGDRRLLFWGDLVEFPSIQFDHTEVTIRYDVDGPAVAAARANAFAEAAARRYWLAASHFPFPGIGHVRTGPAGYEWVPLADDRDH